MRERSRSRESSRSGSSTREPRSTVAGRPRWWRWRSWRTLRHRDPHNDADAAAVDGGDTSLALRLDRLCQVVLSYLPSISTSTRKAIFWCVALLVAWKMILWALELVVTSVCFAVALLIVVCFLRPDLALVLLTEVVPPYLEVARGWLSAAFLSAGLSLTRRQRIIPTAAAAPQALAIEDIPLPPDPPTAPSPSSPPSHRSPRTINLRHHRADSEPALVEAAA